MANPIWAFCWWNLHFINGRPRLVATTTVIVFRTRLPVQKAGDCVCTTRVGVAGACNLVGLGWAMGGMGNSAAKGCVREAQGRIGHIKGSSSSSTDILCSLFSLDMHPWVYSDLCQPKPGTDASRC